jgi:peptidoglycan/xylan/chitin deacetylase (PgdA/CDA1 family)
MEHIFTFLDTVRVKAIFFCLGWIAETYPDIIKAIVDRGYEVGTHTTMHQLIYENIWHKKMIGFLAPKNLNIF